MSLFPVFGPKFLCPICEYRGRFDTYKATTGARKFAVCPKCQSLERHRLQALVFRRITQNWDLGDKAVLHIAPEPALANLLSECGKYQTADLQMPDVNFHIDLQEATPFADATFDIVYASHVLEHIEHDDLALREIRRITKSRGIAILPVPIVGKSTIEYPAPNPAESGHVRAPGWDYFIRYRDYFPRVEVFKSTDFPEAHQLYIYEDRSRYPNDTSPLRTAMPGSRHLDAVPVCYMSVEV